MLELGVLDFGIRAGDAGFCVQCWCSRFFGIRLQRCRAQGSGDSLFPHHKVCVGLGFFGFQ